MFKIKNLSVIIFVLLFFLTLLIQTNEAYAKRPEKPDFQAQIDELRTQIEALQIYVDSGDSGLQTQIDVLQNQVAVLQSQVDSDVSSLQQQVYDLQDEINQLSDTTLQYVEIAPAYMWPFVRHSWADWHLSFLPATAKYIEVAIDAYCGEVVGVRKNGSTVERKIDRANSPNGDPSGVCSSHFTVEPDGNGIIEIFVSYGDTVVSVTGYWK